MSEEKPFAPTKRKLEKERNEGNVFKIPIISQLAVFICVISSAWYLIGASWVRIEALINYCSIGSVREVSFCTEQAFEVFLSITLGSLLAGALVALVSEVLQVGICPRPALILPVLMRLNPVEGSKKLFHSITQAWLLYAKLLLGSVVVVWICSSTIQELAVAGLWSGAETILALKSAAFRLVISGIGMAIGAAGIEWIIKRRRFYRDLSMTAEELKQELKEEEGDPLMRNMRRSLHESILHEDLARRVRQAKVIIVERNTGAA